MSNISLSLVIAVYNTAKSLTNCLDHAVAQDLKDMEIICVDDGSVDESYEILRQYSEKDQRIKILQHNENQGLLQARRTGVEAAQGSYIQFLDSDDHIDAGLCNCVLDLIRENHTDILQYSTCVNYLDKHMRDYMDPVPGKITGSDILRNYYVTGEISTSLVTKIYRAELCQKAFQCIPDFHCYVGEDILTSFFIAYFASSYMGVRTKEKYIYNFGSGISTETAMSLEKFKLYCGMNRFPAIIRDALGQDNEMINDAVRHMIYRIVSDCCINYLKVDDKEKVEAAEIFWTSWSSFPEFPQAFMNAYETQIKDLRNSASYKLGNAIVRPLHDLKMSVFQR